MTKRVIHEQVQDLLNRTERLRYEIERGLRSAKDEMERANFLYSLTEEFTNSSLLAEGLVKEVESNISKGLRPAEELTFTDNVESLLDYVKHKYSQVEEQAWEDNILLRTQIPPYPAYEGSNNSSLSQTNKLLVDVLIDQVRTCCYDFYQSCEDIAMLFRESFYVQQYPDKYPTITSFIPLKEPSKDTAPNELAFIDQPLKEEPNLSQSANQNAQYQTPELEEKEIELNVKLLLAHQRRLLSGKFHNLPKEKQYAILSILFGRNKANIKNALTALYGDANTNKNPRNLPKVVEKANDLITRNELGLALIKNRAE